jgi:hypothetical protein
MADKKISEDPVMVPQPTDWIPLVRGSQNCRALAGNFLKGTLNIYVTASDFTGNEVTVAKAVGKDPQTDIAVYVNAGLGVSGNGTIINANDGFTFVPNTGTFTMPPDNYLIQIYNTI